MLGSEGINYVKNNNPDLAKHLKMLNSLRRSSEALQKGTQVDILMQDDQAVFKRDFGSKIAYVAMTKASGYSYTFTGMQDGTYRKITPNGDTYNEEIITVSGGTASVTVDVNGYVVLDKQ